MSNPVDLDKLDKLRRGIAFRNALERTSPAMAAELRALRERSRVWYEPDGSEVILPSADAVTERRKAAAAELRALRAVRDAAMAVTKREDDPHLWLALDAALEAAKDAGGGDA